MKRSGYMDVHIKNHSCLWWIIIGWWWRPFMTLIWVSLALLLGYKGIKYHHYE